jgi:hypothetical protein
VLPLTWRIMTVNGRDNILKELRMHSQRARPHGFKIPPHRAAPRHVTRAGTESIEAIFSFETAHTTQIDTVGWIFVVFAVAITVVAAVVAYHGSGTLIANTPVSHVAGSPG